jgi:anti-sigma factor RsiW
VKVLTCAATRRRLQAFHDRELSIDDQINVSAHLEWCDACAGTLAGLRELSGLLRLAAPGRAGFSDAETSSLEAMVVSRAHAERTESWGVRFRELLNDMPTVYAGLGAGVATVVCVMILLNMMRFATSEYSPGSNQNPLTIDARILMPRALDQDFLAVSDLRGVDEAAFTVSAVVTREGRAVNVELHAPDESAPLVDGSVEAQVMKSLVDAISLARFEPARVSGLPVAVSMVWIVANTTVRAAKDPLFDITPTAIPTGKKRRV